MEIENKPTKSTITNLIENAIQDEDGMVDIS